MSDTIYMERLGAPVRAATVLGAAAAGMPYLRETLKLALRCCLYYRLMQEWIAFWNSAPQLSQLVHASPGMLKKIYRPYLSKRHDPRRRLEILQEHYRLILRHGLSDIVLRAVAEPVKLAGFAGKSGQSYQIFLVALASMEREGELVLQLHCDSDLLFSVAFSIFEQQGAPVIAIGCLQGGRGPQCAGQIRQTTRDLFGLRPKNLMVRLVQQLGTKLGCRDLLLTGNDNRVIARQLRLGLVLSDYNATWLEMGALAHTNGDFQLPCNYPTPDFLAIASSKRSEAKKRHALLCSITDLACCGFFAQQ